MNYPRTDIGSRIARVATAAVIGGTASKIDGGKFANGAATAAFVRALNHDAHGHGRPGGSRTTAPDDTVTIRVERVVDTGTATLGRLTVDGTKIEAVTLEPEGPDSTVDGSNLRIPEGRYAIARDPGGARANDFELQNVPGRSDVQVHQANLRSETTGCIVPAGTFSAGNSGTQIASQRSMPIMNALNQQIVELRRAEIVITNNIAHPQPSGR